MVQFHFLGSEALERKQRGALPRLLSVEKALTRGGGGVVKCLVHKQMCFMAAVISICIISLIL